jgi:hypothetical protein
MLELYGIDAAMKDLRNHEKTDVAILHIALQRCRVLPETTYEMSFKWMQKALACARAFGGRDLGEAPVPT